jgi:hypothetical protein
MISLLSQVTPLTKALLWFTKEPLSPALAYYKDVDYLLNGLLTSTLMTSENMSSYVLVSENFGNSFYVLIGQSLPEKEIQSFFDLIKPQMNDGNHIVLIDENASFGRIQKLAPVELKSKIQVIQ